MRRGKIVARAGGHAFGCKRSMCRAMFLSSGDDRTRTENACEWGTARGGAASMRCAHFWSTMTWSSTRSRAAATTAAILLSM